MQQRSKETPFQTLILCHQLPTIKPVENSQYSLKTTILMGPRLSKSLAI